MSSTVHVRPDMIDLVDYFYLDPQNLAKHMVTLIYNRPSKKLKNKVSQLKFEHLYEYYIFRSMTFLTLDSRVNPILST